MSAKGTRRRRGGRTAVACTTCRARKVACSFTGPCDACVERGEAETCSLANLLTEEERPSLALKDKLDELERVVAQLRSVSPSGSSPPSTSIVSSPSPYSALVSPLVASDDLQVPLTVTTTATASTCDSRRSSGSSFMHEPGSAGGQTQHESEVLSRLVLGPTELRTSSLSPGLDANALLTELRLQDTQVLTNASLWSGKTLSPLQGDAILDSLIYILPSASQMQVFVPVFMQRVNRLLDLLDASQLQTTLDAASNPGAHQDLLTLGQVFVVATLALSSLSDAESASVLYLDSTQRAALAHSWAERAKQTISLAEEQIGPSAASLRLIALLGHHYATFNGGIGLTNSLSTHAAAISNAFDLSLHLEEELEHELGESVEGKRAVFWSLITLDTLNRAFTGRSHFPVDLDAITTRFPGISGSDEIFTGMSRASLVHAITRALLRVSRAVKSGRRPEEQEILALYSELTTLEEIVGPANDPTLAGLLSFAFLRLHRSRLSPTMALSMQGTTEWHLRETANRSNSLLSSVSANLAGVENVARPYLLAGAASAATTLVILALDVSASDETNAWMWSVQTFLLWLDQLQHADASLARLCARAATVLRHLLALIPTAAPVTLSHDPALSMATSSVLPAISFEEPVTAAFPHSLFQHM